jgi:nitrile hydratase
MVGFLILGSSLHVDVGYFPTRFRLRETNNKHICTSTRKLPNFIARLCRATPLSFTDRVNADDKRLGLKKKGSQMTGIESTSPSLLQIVKAPGEEATYKVGDRVRIASRLPVGHYRVPRYVRGKEAVVQSVIEPAAINNEEEGFGRNAGIRLHYYRVIIPLTELWPAYSFSANDGLHIEVYENWLESL